MTARQMASGEVLKMRNGAWGTGWADPPAPLKRALRRYPSSTRDMGTAGGRSGPAS